MSEYQYYEWQTLDRTLNSAEQAAVRRLSTHIDVSSSRAVVTYQWGDFKHDPKQVLVKYFDAYLYSANWGSRRLMFRFPEGPLNTEAVLAYCMEDFMTLETIDGYQVLGITFDDEEGGGCVEGEGDLPIFVQLRDDLLQGDYRLLYLAWLRAIELSRPDNAENPGSLGHDLEPAVPAGLKKLSDALGRLIKFLDVDPFLVKAASETSPEAKADSVDYGALVALLDREECNDFLTSMANGKTAVTLALRKRLMAFVKQTPQPGPQRRTIQQLIVRAKEIKNEETMRQKEKAKRRHIDEMKALAKGETQAWQEIEELIKVSNSKSYDEATVNLVKLKQLAEFQGAPGVFEERLRSLREKYKTRRSMIDRWQKKRLL